MIVANGPAIAITIFITNSNETLTDIISSSSTAKPDGSIAYITNTIGSL